METINIKDELKMLELQNKALEYTRRVIGINDFDEIYNLMLSLLNKEEDIAALNLDMMKREKKIEKDHEKEVEQLKEQIERLAQLVGKLSKKA